MKSIENNDSYQEQFFESNTFYFEKLTNEIIICFKIC